MYINWYVMWYCIHFRLTFCWQHIIQTPPFWITCFEDWRVFLPSHRCKISHLSIFLDPDFRITCLIYYMVSGSCKACRFWSCNEIDWGRYQYTFCCRDTLLDGSWGTCLVMVEFSRFGYVSFYYRVQKSYMLSLYVWKMCSSAVFGPKFWELSQSFSKSLLIICAVYFSGYWNVWSLCCIWHMECGVHCNWASYLCTSILWSSAHASSFQDCAGSLIYTLQYATMITILYY